MTKRRKSVVLGKAAILAGLALLVAAPLAAGVGLAKARTERAAATARARQRFVGVRAAMTEHLRQRNPLELGAVWATHSGRICGLVDGEGSFGGLTGMVPFFTDGERVLYSPQTDPVVFGRGWMACGQDLWIEIVAGSAQEGYCATRAGARRCAWTSRRQPD